MLSYAMIGNPPLGKIIGPDLGAAIASGHHRLPGISPFFMLAVHFHLIEAGTEYLHGFIPVFMLG